jgi:hypothetical protein
MTKRIAASALWFVSVGWGLNFVAAVVGASQLPGLLIAVVVAAFVGADPFQLFWPAPARPAHASVVSTASAGTPAGQAI